MHERSLLSKYRSALSFPTNQGPPKLEGSFAWPADPFFRPTVGLYLAGVLQGIWPTWRIPPSPLLVQGTPWPCGFAFEWPDAQPAHEDAQLRCMETGEILYHGQEKPPPHTSSVMTVHQLIGFADAASSRFSPGGFEITLSLPASEQLALVYFSILGREPDVVAKAAWTRTLLDSGAVLELRDFLLASEEFRTRRLKKVSPPFGHWLAWSGLADIRDDMASLWPDSNAALSGLAPHRQQDIAEAPDRYAARIALGPVASAVLMARWIADHAQAIARLGGVLRTQHPVQLSTFPSAHSLRLGNVLQDMRVGEAGRRSPTCVELRPDMSGDVLFGPYTSLVSGRYRLTLHFELRSEHSTSAAALTFEIVYGNLLLAMTIINHDDLDRGQSVVEFIVPNSPLALEDARFEYRLRSRGKVAGQITALTLERMSRVYASDNIRTKPMELLPLLGGGRAGEVVGHTIVARHRAVGEVFSGLDRALYPGYWHLSIAFSAPLKGAITRHRHHVTVADSTGKLLARKRVAERSGSLLTLAFTVPSPSSGEEQKPITIRLLKWMGPEVKITSVTAESHFN